MWANTKHIIGVLTAIALTVMATDGAAAQEVITVSPGSTISTLAEAVKSAQTNDIIRLEEGHYVERNIIIDKTLTIESASDQKAVIDADGKGFGLIVRADNVTIRNIEVRGSGISFMDDHAGILFEEVSGGVIENVTLTDNFFGIYLAQTSGTIIRNNSLTASSDRETQSGNGIHLWYSKDIRITGNTVRGHRDGIYFEFVENVTITDNLTEENLRYGLHFMFSDRCAFTGNTFRNNGAGVAVMYTDQVTMEHNHFLDNWGSAAYGLLLKEIRRSKIYHNTFRNNSVGLYMEASSRNRIKFNDFENNGWALKVMSNSMDNQFVKNNFVENSFEVSTNSRQNFNIFNKNYWSHYSGYDLDRDGVGDVPYHPVRLFSVIVEKQPEILMLMRSLLIGILDTAERIMPVLTPEELVDKKPQMARIQ